MRLTTKIGFALGLLLLVALSGIMLSVWGSQRLSTLYQQSDLAHRSYQSYLSLSSRTYQLFKQLGDSLLLREQVIGQRERELLFYINSELVTINRLVDDQRALDASRADEEERIAKAMARLIEHMVVDYQAVVRSINRAPGGTIWRKAAKALDKRLDGEFNPLLATALSNAKLRAERAAAQEAELSEQFRRSAFFVALLSITVTGFLIYWVNRAIKKPLGRLLSGALELTEGNTEHRLTSAKDDAEFKDLVGAFNQMATKVDEREKGLGHLNAQLEQAVAQRTQALESALQKVTILNKTRQQLLADVSHELRTPLTVVRGEADLALRGAEKSPSDYRQAMTATKAAADHMTRLVEDLMFVAKAESEEIQLDLRSYDLVDQIRTLLPQLRHLGQSDVSTNCPIDFIFDRDQYNILADRDRIAQVLMILVENALKYGRAPWAIELTENHSSVCVAICNKGDVLSEELIEQLFVRFFRGSDSSSYYKNGSGLGLPVAKAIVAAHGQELHASSSEAEGTKFYFDIDLSAKPLAQD